MTSRTLLVWNKDSNKSYLIMRKTSKPKNNGEDWGNAFIFSFIPTIETCLV